MNASGIKNIWFRDPTPEAFEARMAPLREALRKEAAKTEVKPCRNLTIRQMADLLDRASGGRHSRLFPIGQFADRYDPDSPDDFNDWNGYAGHYVDPGYAWVSVYANCMNPLKGKDEDWLWAVRLMGHPGDPYDLAKYALVLQEAGVDFCLVNAPNVLKRFNRMAGYRLRSLRLEARKDQTEPAKTI